MRLLFMLDRPFAQREHALVRRVEVGLLDEGAQLARCVPHACSRQLPSGLITQVTYADTGPNITLPWRADRLFRELHAAMPPVAKGEVGLFDAVHAWGENCWDLAAETAEADGADLVLEVYSPATVTLARRFERRWSSVLPEPGRCTISVPSEALRQAANRAGARWPVRVCPWGVFLPESIREPRRPGAPASLCVVGSGEKGPAVTALLEGVADLARRREALESAGAGTLPELLVFLDERIITGNPDVWRYAQRLNLTHTVSVVADLERRREPLLRSDMLALPETTAVQRSVLIDAMAAGVAVITAQDDFCPHAQHLSTAWIITEPRARLWCDAFERLLSDNDLITSIGESARQHAATHCLASNHAGSVFDLHHRLSSGPAAFAAN